MNAPAYPDYSIKLGHEDLELLAFIDAINQYPLAVQAHREADYKDYDAWKKTLDPLYEFKKKIDAYICKVVKNNLVAVIEDNQE